jgi:beta-lactamase regulating signal transducer with metallopeptidase domain
VLALAGGITVCWRKASAASRHLLWTLALATLLVLPFTKLAAPRWIIGLPVKTVQIVLPPVAGPAAVIPVTSRATAVPVSVPTHARSLLSWQTLLMLAWMAGVVAVLSYRVAGSWRLRQLRLQSKSMTDEQLLLLLADCGLENRVELRRSSECRVPLVWGLWRPIVVLPDAALAWPQARLAATVRHEFGHIRRRDCLTLLLAQVVCALYWLNPLVWLAARRLRMAQEQACDDLVLRSGASAADYAEWLVQTVRSLNGQRLIGRHALAMAQPSTLAARVSAIVDDQRNRSPLRGSAWVMGAMAVVALIAGCSLVQGKDNAEMSVSAQGRTPDSTETSHVTSTIAEQAVLKKLKGIVIPEINFTPPVNMVDVIGFLQQASIDFDDLKLPKDQRGVNMVLKLAPKATSPVLPALNARSISLYEALTLVCEKVGMKFRIIGNGVMLVPLNDPIKTETPHVTSTIAEQAVLKKLKGIVIPEIDFTPPADMTDAMDFFRQASIDFDDPKLPKDQRGVNMVLKLALKATSPVLPALNARSISLYDALTLVCEKVGMKFMISGNVVMLVPRNDPIKTETPHVTNVACAEDGLDLAKDEKYRELQDQRNSPYHGQQQLNLAAAALANYLDEKLAKLEERFTVRMEGEALEKYKKEVEQWRAYREFQATYEGKSIGGGGSVEPMVYSDARARITLERYNALLRVWKLT